MFFTIPSLIKICQTAPAAACRKRLTAAGRNEKAEKNIHPKNFLSNCILSFIVPYLTDFLNFNKIFISI